MPEFIPPAADGHITVMATWLHEAYTSFVAAGFTEDQAMDLVSDILTGMLPPNI